MKEHSVKKVFVCDDILITMSMHIFKLLKMKTAHVSIETTTNRAGYVGFKHREFVRLITKINDQDYDGVIDDEEDLVSLGSELSVKKYRTGNRWQVANGGLRCSIGALAIAALKDVERQMLCALI